MLSSELGVYVAEAVIDRNVRGARGRFKMYGDDEVFSLPVLCSNLPNTVL